MIDPLAATGDHGEEQRCYSHSTSFGWPISGEIKKRRKRGKKVMKERECKEYAWVNIGFIRDLVSHFHSVFNKWDRGSVAATSESEDTSDAVLVEKTGDY